MKTLTAAQLDRAVQALRPSLPTIATALNATETALYRWRTGSRTVPPDVCGQLVRYLRRRGKALLTLADHLER